MANFKEKLLGLMDNGVTQAMKLVDTIQETMDGIDWDEQFESLNSVKESLLKKGNDLLGEFNELVKQVKNNISDFEVTVPYDEAIGEKFEKSVDGNKLTIEVTFKNETSERSNKTTVIIPSNCDVEKMTLKHNAVNKTMTVIIPKSFEETSDKEEEKKTEANEEAHTVESKLLRRFRENTARASGTASATTPKVDMPHGANGRFLKRKRTVE